MTDDPLKLHKFSNHELGLMITGLELEIHIGETEPDLITHDIDGNPLPPLEELRADLAAIIAELKRRTTH